LEPKYITIIGAGHGGLASAAYTASLGHRVTIWNRSYPPIEEIIQAGKKSEKGGVIELLFSESSKDEIWRHALDIDRKEILSFAEPAESQTKRRVDVEDLMVMSVYVDKAMAGFPNLELAVEDADVIRVVLPSHAHYDIVDKMSEHLGKKEQILLLEPGRTGGAIEAYNILRRKEVDLEKVTVAEADTFVYTSRKMSKNTSRIIGIKQDVSVAAIPSDRSYRVVEILKDTLYPQFTTANEGSALYTSFNNMGAVFHATLMPLLAGLTDIIKIYRQGQMPVHLNIEFYRTAVNENVGKILEAADKERMAVANAFGLDVLTARTWLKETYDVSGTDLQDALSNCAAYKGILLPDTVNVRYIFEDCRTSALPMALLGEKAQIPCPILYASVIMGGALLEKDFTTDGRTLERMGVADLTIDQIRNLAKTGSPD
jgi:opine dehydrogenase